MGGTQAMKRIPRIKFPQRHPKSSGYAAETQEASGASVSAHTFFSGSKGSTTLGGKASLQPKRTPVSNEEIEAILNSQDNATRVPTMLLFLKSRRSWVAACNTLMELQGGFVFDLEITIFGTISVEFSRRTIC
ncbi:hypothetical protein FNV43_RR09420 [Rhamnella rubrinervis]|uniref:Uncharacterized protein n=1 Tax=Rhamnella rubrinervis TaxID=2594499 RepID=A0A8K0HA26_9ROSA|nr:hypothetical protein FNV43_RR09420 [Rhamnella rubrinervis]